MGESSKDGEESIGGQSQKEDTETKVQRGDTIT
jgi:hypothetical protein